MKKLKYLALFILLGLSIPGVTQKPFTAGNVVVYRVGDGSAALNRSYTKVYLDEYTPDGILVQSIQMPTDNSGSHSRLTARGNMSGMGYLNLTTDGRKLVVPGINSAITDDPSVSNPTASVIGLVDFNGSINTTTAVTDNTEGFFTLSAASNDGNKIWFRVQGAVRYTTLGSSTSVKLNSNAADAATGDIKIADGQLYNNTTSVPLIRTVGSGLPATTGQALTGLPGIPDDIQGAGQFAFADLDPSVAGVDVLYVASSAEFVDASVGIRKFSLVGGVWVSNGSVGGDVDNTRYQGLTIRVSDNVVTLFATRQGNNSSGVRGGELVRFTDNGGYNGSIAGSPTILASVANPNTMAYRGVAMVPQPAPFTAGNVVVYRVGDGSAALNRSYTKVYLDEYTPDGILVQSIQMPTDNSGSHSRLTARGNMSGMGYLNLTTDGRKLVVPGINSAITDDPSVSNPTASVIGLVDFNGSINTTTAVTDNTEGFFTLSAASNDGNKIWFRVQGAVRYTTLGSSTSVKLNSNAADAATGDIKIADGQLYNNTTSVPLIRTVGSGLPATTGQALTGLPGIPDDIQGAGQFAFADLDPSVAGVDVLYVASSAEFVDASVGIRKFSLVGGVWVSNGSVGGDVDNTRYQGLTIRVSGNVVTLFATRQGNNSSGVRGGELVRVTDNSGYNGTITGSPTTLASVANPNTMAYRGVALVPSGCAAIRLIQVPDISASEANVLWNTLSGSGGNYEYAITQNSTPPTSGTFTTDTSISATGLLDNTTYYVHIRIVCSKLSVSEWSTISFVTGCKPPPAPLLNIIINAGGIFTAKWKKVFGATNYEYFISTSSTPPLTGTTITDTALTIFNLNSVTQYYLHVRSECGGGAFSSWTTKSFTTDCFMPAPQVNEISKTTGVKWNKIANAVKYEYALTKNPAKPLSGHLTTDTTYLINNVEDGTSYYFHVRAFCSTGAVSEWNTIPFNGLGLQVYPNPVREHLLIQLNGMANPSGSVYVGDAMGRVVVRINVNSNTANINTRSWAPGIYLVHYNDGKNKYSVRIVKQ